MMRTILSLSLVAVPAMAGSLRGSPPGRQLQGVQIGAVNLKDNQMAFFVGFDMDLLCGDDVPNNPSQADLDTLALIPTQWLTTHVITPILQQASAPGSGKPFAAGEFALYPYFGMNGCESNPVSFSITPAWQGDCGKVDYSAYYLCQMEGVDTPGDVLSLMDSLQGRGVATNSILLDLLQGSGSPLTSYIRNVRTTSLQTGNPSWQAIGNKVRNDNFDNGYVLPFVITWSFATPPAFAKQTDYTATEQATQDWLEQQWDAFYTSAYPGADKFARRTIDVGLRYSSFSPGKGLYSQSLTLGVEVLVGANNITDVPSVTKFTTSMQLYFPVSNFTSTLDTYLEDDSIFKNNTQTTYAITPTFQVAELSESKNKTTIEDIDVVNYAVVSVDVSPDSV